MILIPLPIEVLRRLWQRRSPDQDIATRPIERLLADAELVVDIPIGLDPLGGWGPGEGNFPPRGGFFCGPPPTTPRPRRPPGSVPAGFFSCSLASRPLPPALPPPPFFVGFFFLGCSFPLGAGGVGGVLGAGVYPNIPWGRGFPPEPRRPGRLAGGVSPRLTPPSLPDTFISHLGTNS